MRVDAEQSMLDALEDAGVEVMWDCRKGECGLCTVTVLDARGHLDHRDVFLDEDAEGGRLHPVLLRLPRRQRHGRRTRGRRAGGHRARHRGHHHQTTPAHGREPAVLTIDLP